MPTAICRPLLKTVKIRLSACSTLFAVPLSPGCISRSRSTGPHEAGLAGREERAIPMRLLWRQDLASLTYLLLGMVSLMCLVFSEGLAQHAAVEAHRYVEENGTTRQEVQWCLTRTNDSGSQLVYHTSQQTHLTRTDAALHTQAWSMRDHREETDVEVLRQGNSLVVQGRWRGAVILKQIELDDSPWFQATSLSLRPFILSGQAAVSFWTLRPDTLKAYKITATRQGVESLSVPSGQTSAVRVELRLGGLLAPFWRGRYWFRASDGLFLRFDGSGDASGRFPATVVYAGPSDTGCLETGKPVTP